MNALFTDFYQDVARGHFTVKRLEKAYGAMQIQSQYQELSKALISKSKT
ncbi:hypothetical protein [Paucibacter sp. XJ19-41]|nr:hypothetical protein [Paucibacter sp. XJ19-41]MDC6168041.1 hypothetical protein [Paucibacter sp. XJ19-41]